MTVQLPSDQKRIAAEKFQNPSQTAKGEERAVVSLKSLDTLWFNTGTRCNLQCDHCYIESSPVNDRLAYLTRSDVEPFLEEIRTRNLSTGEIGFTGGEPFLNPHFLDLLTACLEGGWSVLVLTNAMKPMMKKSEALLAIQRKHGTRLHFRVSLDHHTATLHDLLRGEDSWKRTMTGLRWLRDQDFKITVAGRTCWQESETDLRAGYQRLFQRLKLGLEAQNPAELVLFPEMDPLADVPEITTNCWGILGVNPNHMMCATSRMVVKRKEAEGARVVACTLLPYDPQFELGTTLAEASRSVPLNHPFCAEFCVLGRASCSN